MFKIFKLILVNILYRATLCTSISTKTQVKRDEQITENSEIQDVFAEFRFNIHIRDFPVDCWLFIGLGKLIKILTSVNDNEKMKSDYFNDILILYDSGDPIFAFISIYVVDKDMLENYSNKIEHLIEYEITRSIKGVLVDIVNNLQGLLISFLEQTKHVFKHVSNKDKEDCFNVLIKNYKSGVNNYETKLISGCVDPYKVLNFKINQHSKVKRIEKEKIDQFEIKWSTLFTEESILKLLEIASSLKKYTFDHYDLIKKFELLDNTIPKKNFIELVKQQPIVVFRMLVFYIKELETGSLQKGDTLFPNKIIGLLDEIKDVLIRLKDIFVIRIAEAARRRIDIYIDANLWGLFQPPKSVKIPFPVHFDFKVHEYKSISRFNKRFYYRTGINNNVYPEDIILFAQLVCNQILEALNLLKEIIEFDYSVW
eukprot:GAHX01003137.1.p1 GENE.GAHX01003137.1~~GAHX01003137.1.p1  ORF type:complete len:426 (-),score=68.01 GAHX01003137.1:298-1575(-)